MYSLVRARCRKHKTRAFYSIKHSSPQHHKKCQHRRCESNKDHPRSPLAMLKDLHKEAQVSCRFESPQRHRHLKYRKYFIAHNSRFIMLLTLAHLRNQCRFFRIPIDILHSSQLGLKKC